MKALSMWQPWASLVVSGDKRVETRGWAAPPTMEGRRFAIHATKTGQHLHLAGTDPFCHYIPDPDGLPLGAIVGTAVLKRCAPMTEEGIARMAREQHHEFAFGEYALGRFAWVLADPVELAEPIPWDGRQRIFEIPAEVLGLQEEAPPEPAQGALL